MEKKKRNRGIPIQFYVTQEEKEKIEENAKKCKMDMSTYLRMVSVDGIIVNRDIKGIKEFNKIGVNINQIAKVVNETKSVHKNSFDRLKEEFDKLYNIVCEKILKG